MLFPASEIAIAEARCPSCAEQVAGGDRACVSCGYGFEFAAQLLPYEAPELRKFIDREGLLTRDDIKRGQHAIEKLREKFPQITLCTCLATVPAEVSNSEFGFWLFNQSVPNGPRLVDRRLHSILLCIDPVNQNASLTVGYGLDPFIDDAALNECLEKIQKPLAMQNYGAAITRLCRALLPVLDEGFEQANLTYKELVDAERRRRQKEPANVGPVRADAPLTSTEANTAETSHNSHV